MNYIYLLRKLCYKDKSINYFRSLPGKEGVLFKEMVTWLEGYYKKRNEHNKATERIQIALNRVRANYLGIVFEVEHNQVALEYDDDRLNNILSILYFKSVNDPTRFGDVKSKANVLLGVIPEEDEILKSLPNSLQTIMEDVHWQNYEEPEPFDSSFKPEIDIWDTSGCGNVEKPIHWCYWELILDPNKLFWNGCNHEDIDFIVRLLSQKEQRQQACEVLKNALKEYSIENIGFVSNTLKKYFEKLRDEIDNDRIKPVKMPKSYYKKEDTPAQEQSESESQSHLKDSDCLKKAILATYNKYNLIKKEFSLFYLVTKGVIDKHCTQGQMLSYIKESGIPSDKIPSISSMKALSSNNNYPKLNIQGISINDSERCDEIGKFFHNEYKRLKN